MSGASGDGDGGRQQNLFGEVACPEAHLTQRYEGEASVPKLECSGPREYWCRDCWNRVTRSQDGDGEYGHQTDCDHHHTL